IEGCRDMISSRVKKKTKTQMLYDFVTKKDFRKWIIVAIIVTLIFATLLTALLVKPKKPKKPLEHKPRKKVRMRFVPRGMAWQRGKKL
ncbi:hypothetical protein D6777_02655, partial [Candidatus Woesearchaeota archaeon]